MTLSSEGLIEGDTRFKLEHMDYREGKHQHCQGLQPCLSFHNGQGLADQGLALAEVTSA